MKYINLNDYYSKKEKTHKYGIKEVLLTGQAPNKGLFVPEKLITYDAKTIKSLKNQPYSTVASTILYPYFNDIPKKDFTTMLLIAQSHCWHKIHLFQMSSSLTILD